jgi:hypothetical protein
MISELFNSDAVQFVKSLLTYLSSMDFLFLVLYMTSMRTLLAMHTGGHSTQSPAGCCLQLHKLGLFGCAKYRVIYSRIPLCSSQSSWCILAILLGSYYSKRREHLAKVPIWFVPHFFCCCPDVKSTSLSASHYHWHRGLHPPFVLPMDWFNFD